MYPSPDLHCAKLQQRPAEESARPISADNLPEKLSLPPPSSILRLRFFQIFLLLIRSFRSSSFAKGPFFFVPHDSFSLFPIRFFLSSSCQGFVASPYLARAIREHRRHERRRYKLESTAELWGSEGGGEERRKDRERRRQSTREGEKRTSLTSLFTVAFQIPRNPAHL